MLRNEPIKIIVHHTADSTLGPQFGKVDNYHKQRGFILSSYGYYVGYHYFIERDGTVKQARKLTDEGCHTIGENTQSIGICLAGNFDFDIPTKQQKLSLEKLTDELAITYKIPIERVVGHRTHSKTSCPGRNLSDDIPRWGLYKKELDRLTRILWELFRKIGL